MEDSPHPNDEAKILIRCTRSQRERIKIKAQAANLSMNDYILRSALKDKRYKDHEGAAGLQPLYAELLRMNLRLQSLPDTTTVQEAIALVQAVQGYGNDPIPLANQWEKNQFAQLCKKMCSYRPPRGGLSRIKE